MTSAPVAWRPRSQRDLGNARELVDSALSEWQTQWFSIAHFRVENATYLSDFESLPHDGKHVNCGCCEGIRIDLVADIDRILVEAAYAITVDVYHAPSCHESLKAVSVDILDDLIGALHSVLAPLDGTDSVKALPDRHQATAPAYPYGAVQLTVATRDDAHVGTLVIDIRHIWSRGRISPAAGAARVFDDPEVTRRRALDDTPIALSVLLGRCELSAAALSTLSVGDVIALDQALSEPLPLIVEPAGTQVALGTPGRTGSSFSFQLTSILTPPSV
ncbi:FliM/FliN family flagellar motor switch protein [Burkholderia ambifaria]|uniref:FliM/FliN family flagellar motor switch protein n=1 Tax=Burkholderia ambifaria TaxID=152480 RepID=UPI0015897E0A|nr:FliM/FliN family flagellar motor C-terminal domain-containing protein [Burkholderia ambifaria]